MEKSKAIQHVELSEDDIKTLEVGLDAEITQDLSPEEAAAWADFCPQLSIEDKAEIALYFPPKARS